MKKKKTIFINGPIGPDFIADSIAKHQHKTEIGGHEIFLGQVRADETEEGRVESIEFSAYESMAEDRIASIREEAFSKFDLSCMHIYHSLGKVNIGEICFFVFASSGHRKDCRMAVAWLVDEIKKDVPIFGKELMDGGQYRWKENRKIT